MMKLTVNIDETKIMILRKGGNLQRKILVYYTNLKYSGFSFLVS